MIEQPPSNPEPIDWVTFQARLLSDRQLRASFRRDPGATARSSGLRDTDLAIANEIDADDLEAQAETLITKRMRAVEQLLPFTWDRVGDDAAEHFRDYAQTSWPAGHRHHLLDAAGFCEHLRRHRIPSVCRAEANLARFAGGTARLRLHLVGNLCIDGRRRPGLQVLYRRSGRVRQFVTYLAVH